MLTAELGKVVDLCPHRLIWSSATNTLPKGWGTSLLAEYYALNFAHLKCYVPAYCEFDSYGPVLNRA